MSDEQFLAELEAGTLPREEFHHDGHLRAAWLYLTRFEPAEAIARFCRALKGYAAALGKPEKYHETVSWAYLLLINERIRREADAAGWEQFAARHGELFDWQNSVLLRYYRQETLDSAEARRTFLMPDRICWGGAGEAGRPL